MRFILVVIAVLIGIALCIKLDTGTLDASQVAGVGIICLGIAIVSPLGWPSA